MATTPRRTAWLNGGPEALGQKPAFSVNEVSSDIVYLCERQCALEDGVGGGSGGGLGERYVALLSALFKYPIYGKQLKGSFSVFITQNFENNNDHNLKNLLICLFEYTSEILALEHLVIHLKRSCFETESQVLVRNLSWLGGRLVRDKDQYNDWFVLEFEV